MTTSPHHRYVRAAVVASFALLAAGSSARAEEITGVQAASLDQPRIYLAVRRQPAGPMLTAKADGQSTFAVECFLDTGASGIVLSKGTTDGLGIRAAKTQQGTDVLFEDVGVGGAEHFQVSEPLYLSFSAYSSLTEGDNEHAYSPPVGPSRVQLRPDAGLMDALTGGMDVAGMPAMAGKVMLIDARPLNTFTDKLKTSIVAPGSPDIPKVDHVVPLTPVSFQRFTRTVPSAAGGPSIAPNPLIGPDPFKPGDPRPAVQATFRGKGVKMAMLLDTGAACSMISEKQAAALGVKYNADRSSLVGIPEKEQFSLTVGGIGGQKSSRGFFLETLQLPTKDGKGLKYVKAPVLVNDITVADAKTGESFTLDGVFGMNYLVATAAISGGLLPDIGNLTEGPFAYIVIDHSTSTMGLKMAGHK